MARNKSGTLIIIGWRWRARRIPTQTASNYWNNIPGIQRRFRRRIEQSEVTQIEALNSAVATLTGNPGVGNWTLSVAAKVSSLAAFRDLKKAWRDRQRRCGSAFGCRVRLITLAVDNRESVRDVHRAVSRLATLRRGS